MLALLALQMGQVLFTLMMSWIPSDFLAHDPFSPLTHCQSPLRNSRKSIKYAHIKKLVINIHGQW